MTNSQLYCIKKYRRDTNQTRVDLGFQDRQTWKDAPAIFDEHTLKIFGHPVMEDIEANHEVAEKAREFAKNATHPVEVLEGLWEEVIDQVPN